MSNDQEVLEHIRELRLYIRYIVRDNTLAHYQADRLRDSINKIAKAVKENRDDAA